MKKIKVLFQILLPIAILTAVATVQASELDEVVTKTLAESQVLYEAYRKEVDQNKLSPAEEIKATIEDIQNEDYSMYAPERSVSSDLIKQ